MESKRVFEVKYKRAVQEEVTIYVEANDESEISGIMELHRKDNYSDAYLKSIESKTVLRVGKKFEVQLAQIQCDECKRQISLRTEPSYCGACIPF